MNLEQICCGCFREKPNGAPVCPYCGFCAGEAQPFLALPVGTLLNGRYMTGRVLGVGGFGITYLGYDLTLEIKVAIKEYMPAGLATRHSDQYSVALTGRGREDFQNGMERFLEEARILARLQNTPNIVSVQNYFKENNTAYFVMEYIDGMSLKAYLAAQGGKIPYDQALTVLLPVMRALTQVHALHLTHRDISPDNIFITSKGESKLLDFGAARFSSGDEKSASVILKHGYAPEEQYSSKGNQGPWTDVYAMGATLYRCVTGQLPPASITRVHHDALQKPSALGISLPPHVEEAILKALAVKAEDRFPTMAAFIEGIKGENRGRVRRRTAASPGDPTAGGAGERRRLWTRLRHQPRGVRVLALALCIAAAGLGAWRAAVGIGALAGVQSEPDADASGLAAQEPDGADHVALRDYTEAYLNITVGIPEGYAETESGSGTFASSDGQSALHIGFYDKAAGFPVYTLSDVESNAEKFVRYSVGLLERPALTKQEITDRGYRKIGALDAYQIRFSAEGGGAAMDVLAAFIECRNGFGCYSLVGAYPRGDEAAGAEIFAAIDSFRSSGPAGTIYRRFYDEKLPFQFLYWENAEDIQFNAVSESCLEMHSSKLSMEVHCQPLNDLQNPEILLDASKEKMTGMSGVAPRGARWQCESGGIDWTVDGYTLTEEGQTAYIDAYAGASDGYVFLVLVAAETENDLFDGLLLNVTDSIRPVKS